MQFLLLPLLMLSSAGCESALVRDYNRYDRIGDYDGAFEYLEMALARDPSNAEAHFLKGHVLLEKQEYPQARSAFEEASALTARYDERIAFLLQQRYRRHLKEGVLSFGAHQYADAVKALALAVGVDPGSGEAYRMLGHAYAQDGALEKAGAAYENGLLQDSLDVEMLRSYGEVAFALRRYDRSVALLSAAMQIDPENIAVRRRLAHAFASGRSLEQAEQTLLELLAMGGDDEDRMHLGFILFNQQKYSDAIPYLQQTTRVQSGNADVFRALAESLFEAGRYGEAVQANNRLLELVPGDRFAMSNLVKNYEKLGDLTKARSMQDQLNNREGPSNE